MLNRCHRLILLKCQVILLLWKGDNFSIKFPPRTSSNFKGKWSHSWMKEFIPSWSNLLLWLVSYETLRSRSVISLRTVPLHYKKVKGYKYEYFVGYKYEWFIGYKYEWFIGYKYAWFIGCGYEWFIGRLQIWVIYRLQIWVIYSLGIWVVYRLQIWMIYRLQIWVMYRLLSDLYAANMSNFIWQ